MGSCVSGSNKIRALKTASLIKIDDTWELKSRVVSLVVKLASMSSNFEVKFDHYIKNKNKELALNYKLKQVILEKILAKVHCLLNSFKAENINIFWKKARIGEITRNFESELKEYESRTLKIQNMIDGDEYTNYFDDKWVEIHRIKSEIESRFTKS